MSRDELDGFLKAYGVFLEYLAEDLERESELGQRLWERRQAELGFDSEDPKR